MNAKKIIFVLTMCVVASGCGTNNPTGGTFQFTASGEVLALNGYAFPPTAGQTAFVDGWEVQFSKLLVTIDHITLSENPDLSPTDQSQTGKNIAQLNGPWAIDLHQGGPLPGKGGGDEEAYPIATLNKQNLNGNAPFDETVRYAFSFDVVPATASATFLQMDANDTDYADMVQNGWTVLYIGTATWNGGSSCTSTNPSFDFTKLPTPVNFRFGFKSPTTYINCQNPDNDPAKGLGNEEHERGIQTKANQTVVAQVTIHTDHPFWESFVHDSPAHFDQLAALATGTPGNYSVTLNDTDNVNYQAFTFETNPLPWRSCLSTYTPPNNFPQMDFVSANVPYVPRPSCDPAHDMCDYHDYMTYDQSTQGHLNADGLCFVSRNYPSPP